MSKIYSAEVREKAVRLVLEHRGDYPSESEAIRTIAERMSLKAETVRVWVRKAESTTKDPAPATLPAEAEAELKALRRKTRELEQTIEILKAATSFFVRECGPPHK